VVSAGWICCKSAWLYAQSEKLTGCMSMQPAVVLDLFWIES
jgi:hypothetical protein